MSKKLLLASLGTGVLVLVVVGFWMKPLSLDKNTASQVQESERSKKENIEARNAFMARMLRNPQTNRIPANIRQKELTFAQQLPDREGAGKLATTSYASRGPFNQGGRTRALAYDISDNTNNTILAGGASGGIWRTTDGGASWSKMTGVLDLHSITWLEQDIRSGGENIWYASTGEGLGTLQSGAGDTELLHGNGIYKSTNSGVTWTLLAATKSDTPQTLDQDKFDIVWRVQTDPSNGAEDEVYAATYDGIQRSVNGGTSWTNVLNATDFFSQEADVAVSSAGRVFAALSSKGNTKGIHCSLNGTSWTDITPGSFPSTYARLVLEIAPADENVLYVIGHKSGTGPTNHLLWKITMNADACTVASSVDRSANLPAFGGNVGDFDSQSGYDLLVSSDPGDVDFVLVGGTSLYRSTDGFATTNNTRWIGGYSPANDISDYPNQHPDQHVIVWHPTTATTVLAGHDGGISQTTDITRDQAGNEPVAWTALNNGMLTTQFFGVCMNMNTSDAVIAGGMQDNGTMSAVSTASNTSWKAETGGDGANCAISDDGLSRYMSTQNGNLTRNVYTNATDEGGNQANFTNVTPSGATGQLFVNPFALDPGDSKIMYYAAGTSLWRNSDLTGITLGSNDKTSTNWAELTSAQVSGTSISAVAVSTTSNANVVAYGTTNGQVYVLTDANTGTTPTRTDVWTGKGFPTAFVRGIAIDREDSDQMMVVFSNYGVQSIFFTTNGGTNWTNVSGNLEENTDGSGNGPAVFWAEILPINATQTRYYVGTSTGLYSTITLNGTSTTWTREAATTIGNVPVYMVVARVTDNQVIVGTHGTGTYAATETALPVELTTFDVRVENQDALLSWTTASETNNAGFDIEHQRGRGSWTSLAFVEGYGTTAHANNYTFRAEQLDVGTHRFRLKQVDFDGTFEYSSPLSAIIELPSVYDVSAAFPNPFQTNTSFDVTLNSAQEVRIAVYDAAGRQIALLHEGRLMGHVPHRFTWAGETAPNGTYFVRTEGETFTETQSIVRVR